MYFILNYEYFMKAVGGVERFKEIMIWLPTWHDVRGLLRAYSVTDSQVADHLTVRRAIEHRSERVALYELLSSILTQQSV